MSFNYITKYGVTFYLRLCGDNEFDKFWLPYFVKPPTHPHIQPPSTIKVHGSSCLQCVLGVVKMICNLIWSWVLFFVFVLGRNNNVKFSQCKIWKDFYLKGDMWYFLNIFWSFFFFFFFFFFFSMNTMFRKEEGSYTYSSWVWEASRPK